MRRLLMPMSGILKYLTVLLLPLMSYGQVGFLSVDGPANTTIYLDSVLISRQPFKNLAIQPGQYTLSVNPAASFSWQQRTQARQIEIKPFDETYVDLGSMQAVSIFSDPIGSDVFQGVRFLGKTPVIVSKGLLTGEELNIKRAGYKSETFTLQNDRNDYSVTLAPLDQSEAGRINPTVAGAAQVNWFRESLVLTSFVSSWAAFLFKRKADSMYNQYEHASMPSSIDYFYSETEKYDHYSDVAIGVSAVSLGIYLYLLITD
jgi:hypothetical protein